MKGSHLDKVVADSPILVTGIIRSGTTWVGKVLCHAPGTIYLHEPTNPASPWNAAIRTPLQHFYLHNDFAGIYENLFSRLLKLEPRVEGKWLQEHAIWLADYIERRRAAQGIRDLRCVIKDPTAIFSTPWMVDSLQVQPIIVLRHPLSIVRSLLRLGWANRFNPLFIAKQPLLMREIYGGISTADRALLTPNWQDCQPLDRALRWVRLMYLALVCFKQAYPHWYYVSYEGLTQEPVEGFTALSERFDLRLNHTALSQIFEPSDETFDISIAHQASLVPQPDQLQQVFEEDQYSSQWKELYQRWFADLHPVFADVCEWP
ncbi:MAG: hypothetical protein ACI9GW_001943 [Halieaceae bacterium]|jgi:hypothetical protein